MTTKIDQVYEQILPELARNGVEDTPQNRFWALEGLLDAWIEDPDTNMEKSIWVMAVQIEMLVLSTKLLTERNSSETQDSHPQHS